MRHAQLVHSVSRRIPRQNGGAAGIPLDAVGRAREAPELFARSPARCGFPPAETAHAFREISKHLPPALGRHGTESSTQSRPPLDSATMRQTDRYGSVRISRVCHRKDGMNAEFVGFSTLRLQWVRIKAMSASISSTANMCWASLKRGSHSERGAPQGHNATPDTRRVSFWTFAPETRDSVASLNPGRCIRRLTKGTDYEFQFQPRVRRENPSIGQSGA
jgi:hypothetical protein